MKKKVDRYGPWNKIREVATSHIDASTNVDNISTVNQSALNSDIIDKIDISKVQAKINATSGSSSTFNSDIENQEVYNSPPQIENKLIPNTNILDQIL